MNLGEHVQKQGAIERPMAITSRRLAALVGKSSLAKMCNIEALIIAIGFWGPFY